MSIYSSIRANLSAWTETVAAAVIAGYERLRSPRVVRLVEVENNTFVVEMERKADGTPSRISVVDGALSAGNLKPLLRGSRVELVLDPMRFLFRPLDLPARASDFLEGIVRAQIDRLTPWSASEAVFGCSVPTPNGTDTVMTVVAATTRKAVTVYAGAVSVFHPASVAIYTDTTEYNAGRIKVLEQKARGHLDPLRLGRALLVSLLAMLLAAVVSVAAATYATDTLGTQEAELIRQISARRVAIRSGADGSDRSPGAMLERRKHETPSAVIMIEALSRLLPDHTYVTELHLAGSKLQISGITRDAPSLIPLIEQSRHFTRATFYAPTTRASSDPGERFHVETRVEPNNTVTP